MLLFITPTVMGGNSSKSTPEVPDPKMKTDGENSNQSTSSTADTGTDQATSGPLPSQSTTDGPDPLPAGVPESTDVPHQTSNFDDEGKNYS